MDARKGGMTLLELLIATALVAVAALVVAQAFAAGVRVWSRASQLSGHYADSVLALEQWQQELRNTLPCRRTSFRGGRTWMEIPALIAEPGKGGPGSQPGLIRYEFDVAGQKLERVPTLCVSGASDAVRRETVAGGVKSIEFSYAGRSGGGGSALEWEQAWEGRTNTPVAVKVMWRGQQGEEPFEFERTVALPVR
jgi:prepilin-type N-terminal cleavage/methylation domain-containing protein